MGKYWELPLRASKLVLNIALFEKTQQKASVRKQLKLGKL